MFALLLVVCDVNCSAILPSLLRWRVESEQLYPVGVRVCVHTSNTSVYGCTCVLLHVLKKMKRIETKKGRTIVREVGFA